MLSAKTQQEIEKEVDFFVDRLSEILLMQVETEEAEEQVVEGAPNAQQDDTK